MKTISAEDNLFIILTDTMKFEFDAGVIIYSYFEGERRFLALRREEGWLDTPKGHIEKGEDAKAAALRETLEETGLKVDLDQYFRDELEYWYVRNKIKIKKHVTYYLAKVDMDSNVKVSYEHAGYEWIGLGGTKLFKNYESLLKRANNYIDKLEKMMILNAEYSKLPHKIRRWGLSKNFVPGDGPLNARIMVVGQAPGRFEDEQRKPFIGMAGKLLTILLKKGGLRRDRVYITSVVQFFPPDNRLPTDDEAALCLPFLKKQIEIIGPKLVVLLGNFAASKVNGTKEVMKNHGKLIRSKAYGCDLFISLHPAAAVRMKKFVPLMEKDFESLKGIIKDNGLLE